jgi:hypothetical protein
MPVLLQHSSEEPRYDAETLRKVTALAQRLQRERQETLTAREMEAIGAEVGLEAPFIRQALERVTAQHPVVQLPVASNVPMRRAIAAAWWAAGWVVPFILLFIGNGLGAQRIGGMSGFFGGWGIYIAAGIVLGGWVREGETVTENAPHSRADLLNALAALPGVSAGPVLKPHRAFLSVAVAGLDTLAGEPGVEHTVAQLWNWAEEIARAYGGELQGVAGDGVAFAFTEDAAALRAARALQTGLPRFNVERHRHSQPLRLRCGLSAGDLDPAVSAGRQPDPLLDRAAQFRRGAAPGDIVVGAELAAAGLIELGGLAPVAVAGTEPAFSWQAAQRRAGE